MLRRCLQGPLGYNGHYVLSFVFAAFSKSEEPSRGLCAKELPALWPGSLGAKTRKEWKNASILNRKLEFVFFMLSIFPCKFSLLLVFAVWLC